jgi:hypothetical protein
MPMCVLEQSPNRLVLEIRPVGLMILCLGLAGMFLILGLGMGSVIRLFGGMTGMPGVSGVPLAPGFGLIGYAAIIPLGVAVFALKTRRLSLDRTTGLVTIATRGVLGRGEKTWPLADFQGATLTRSRSGTNGTTYRAVLQFKGQLVPVTPYGTSGGGPARTVNAINGWYGPQVAGATILTGDQSADVLAALEKLGIKVPR